MVMILVRSGMPLIVMRREIDLLNRYRLTAVVTVILKKFLYPLTTKYLRRVQKIRLVNFGVQPEYVVLLIDLHIKRN